MTEINCQKTARKMTFTPLKARFVPSALFLHVSLSLTAPRSSVDVMLTGQCIEWARLLKKINVRLTTLLL